MNTPTTPPTLTGSWRNFSPKLDAETARLFDQLDEDTMELLRKAGRQSSVMMEEPAKYQATPKKD